MVAQRSQVRAFMGVTMKLSFVRSKLLLGTSAMAALMVPAAPALAQTAPATTDAASAKPAAQDQAMDTQTAPGIMVVGNRYQASSLQMRAANTTSVLSAQDLQHTAVHNVAEALGMLPGINVMNTGSAFASGADGASRGEGMFVSVRGMNAEYNINLINGVSVAQGNPYSRGVQLSLLPPSGLQTIVLNKTSQADMQGDAIGGTIDFRTPSAFDYAASSRGSLTFGGRMESRARSYGQSGLGWNVGGDYSRKFGSGGQFGIYVSGFYDIRHYANSLVGGVQESGCCDNGFDFAVQNAAGGTPAGINPASNLILTAANFGMSSGYTERFGGNGTFDWRPDENTAIYLRGSYARANTQQNSTLDQIVATDKSDGSSGTALGNGTYAPVLGGIQTRLWYETNPEIATLGTLQLGMDKHLGHLTVSPNLFYSWGSNARPNHIEVAGRYASVPYGGSSLFGYSDNYPVPLLSSQLVSQLNNVSAMPATGGAPELTTQSSQQKKGGAKLDLRYDFDGGMVSFVKVGARYETSHRDITNRDYTVPGYGSATTMGDLGLFSSFYPAVYPGRYNYQVPQINQPKLFALFNQLGGATDATIDTCGSNPVNSYNCNTQGANETVYAGYAMGQLTFGKLEVIPGIRYEHTDIKNEFWVTPTSDGNTLTGNFSSNRAHFDALLPSLALNYRADHAVYRAAIWTSYVRPPFLQLGGGASTSVSGGVTTITQGNPNLKAIRALNLDASGEWTFGSGTHVMIAAFYKHLSNYIYDNGSSAGIVTGSTAGVTNGTITYQPQNGGDGHVYGVEMQARQKFSALPGLLSGLGVGVNLTRQWTRVDVLGDGTRYDRIQNAPDVMANAQLFYEKGPVSFDVNYTYSGQYVSIYDTLGQNSTWDDVWVRPVSRVDLHAGYEFNKMFKIDLSVSNLFNTYSYWSHIGKNSLAISDIVNSGTTSLLTATVKF